MDGKNRNTPKLYDDFTPRIGDLIYLNANNTLYEIRDVKYFNEAFGLNPHTYTLTLKVYKDSKLSICINDSIPKNDVIFNYANKDLSSQYELKDSLSKNKILDFNDLKQSNNINHMDILFNPNKDYETLDDYYNNIDWNDFTEPFNKFDKELSIIETETHENKEFVEEKHKKDKEMIDKVKKDVNNSSSLVNDLNYTVEKLVDTITDNEHIDN